MRFHSLARAGALIAGFTGVLSCSDQNGPGLASISVFLKDAPGEVTAAVVTISEINLQGSGGSVSLSTTPVTTDLTTLATDVISLVDGVTIPAGTYTQLRFVITDAYIEVENDDGSFSVYTSSPNYAGLVEFPPIGPVVGSLQMPSFEQSGLKVILPGNALTISDGDQELLVVDFDVQQSFGHLAGNSGQWVMHPVIKATSIAATGSALVTLTLGEGVTLPGTTTLGEFTATITGSDLVDRTLPFTDANLDGTFEARFGLLAPGDYTVNLTAPAAIATFTTEPTLPGVLTVPSGGTGVAAFVLTGTTAAEST
jgi:hypothetical protein